MNQSGVRSLEEGNFTMSLTDDLGDIRQRIAQIEHEQAEMKKSIFNMKNFEELNLTKISQGNMDSSRMGRRIDYASGKETPGAGEIIS